MIIYNICVAPNPITPKTYPTFKADGNCLSKSKYSNIDTNIGEQERNIITVSTLVI